MWPEAQVVERFLRRVRRRLVLLRAAEGAAAGLLLGAVLGLVGIPFTAAITAAVVLTAVRVALGDEWRWGWWRSLPAIAQRAERRTSVGHNLIVTAAELPYTARSYVNDIVVRRAAQVADQVNLSALFPALRTLGFLGIAVAALTFSRLRPAQPPVRLDRGVAASSGPVIRRLVFTVTPPAYSGRPRTTLTNPSRIEVLANSRIDISAEAYASSVRLETLAGSLDLRQSAGAFRGGFSASADGFVAVEPRDSAGVPGPRSLVGLSVIEDRPPRVSLTSPGRDLFFSAVPGTLPVAINADDDLELASLQLRYTAVSGSGERFTFVERDVPLTVNRSTRQAWTARGTWNLGRLQLTPGDLVVYRAIVTDRRPGAQPVESESFVIEVVTPGAIAAEGFAADDQKDRYALSQQMVILKTERLLARRGSMASDSVAGESRLLSAEQRQVRAEFVFMMGGEVEDLAEEVAGTLELNEVAEAEAEGDLLAGRLQNQGRVDMMRAIRAMSRASATLTEANLDQALRDERVALDNLMRAFSRSRFILRALTRRERIDLERRLSGTLNLTAGLSGPATEAIPDARVVCLRRLLASVAAWSSRDSGATTAVSDAVLALVRADPASETVRDVVARVQGLTRRSRPAPTAIDSLVREIADVIGRSLPVSPNESTDLQSDRLQGALRDVSRPRGSPR